MPGYSMRVSLAQIDQLELLYLDAGGRGAAEVARRAGERLGLELNGDVSGKGRSIINTCRSTGNPVRLIWALMCERLCKPHFAGFRLANAYPDF